MAQIEEQPLGALPPALQDRVHERLLAPTFRPDELVTPDELRAAWVGPDAGPSTVVLADGEPVAVALGEWGADGAVLLLTYLAVGPGARGLGLGTRLVGEVLPAWAAARPGALVLAEVDDPRRWPAEATQGDPVARLRFYGRHGARLLPFGYVQPALRPGAHRVDGMLLLRLDTTPGVPAATLAAFLEENVRSAEGPDALADPVVARMLARARDVDLDADLLPVDRWADVPPA